MHASVRAQRALMGNLMESAENSQDGLHHWVFEPFCDAEAFQIVMGIVHGFIDMIPKSVTLRTLADIAVVMDDLRCE